MTEILGLITARGGSKSIPRKNILLLAGKPLIAWSIEAALSSQRLSRLIVPTDDEEIAQVATEWGAEVPFLRPQELAQDTSPHILVVNHTIEWLEKNENVHPDYIMLLQPTSPFRTSQDIDAAIDIGQKHNAAAVVSVTEAENHPYLTKCIQVDGTLADFVTTDIAYLRRQSLPPAYTLNGAIYLNRQASLLQDQTFLPPGTYPYIMPPERSIDIDTAWDFSLADLILRHQDEFRNH